MFIRSLARLSSSVATRDVASLKKYGNVVGGSGAMHGPSVTTFESWHNVLENAMMNPESDTAAAMKEHFGPHVADGVKFYPPTYFTHWEGKDEVRVK
jgi:hypothetical protein